MIIGAQIRYVHIPDEVDINGTLRSRVCIPLLFVRYCFAFHCVFANEFRNKLFAKRNTVVLRLVAPDNIMLITLEQLLEYVPISGISLF